MTIRPLSSLIFDSKVIPDDTVLDDPDRLQYETSFWQKLIHFRTRYRLDNSIQQQVAELFRKRYGFQNIDAFNRAWKRIGANVWSPSTILTAGSLRAIDRAFQARLVYHGQGIPIPTSPSSEIDKNVQNIVQVLMHGGHFSRDMLRQNIIKAIFVNKNSELLSHFRLELQREIDSLTANPPKNEREEVMWRCFLGNLIALLPFTYPTSQDTISIPLFEKGICRKVTYNIEVISLPMPGTSSPMTALGLTASSDKTAKPILTFLGTTYPAGDGYAATLLSDFTPGYSVGEAVFDHNQKTIENWLKGKKEIHALGLSLGGAMVFHLLRHYPEALQRADVYNPPGLYANCWVNKNNPPCPVNIYCQTGDLVSHLGSWPTGKNVSLYLVLQHHKGVSNNLFNAHARAYTGCEMVTIVKEDPKKENNSLPRRFLTMLHQWLGPILIYLPLKCSIWFYHQTQAIAHWATAFFKK